MNAIMIIAAVLVLTIGIILWSIDSRVFLYFWYKIIFRKANKYPVLNDEKYKLFQGAFLLEQNWITIQKELFEYIQTQKHIPRFHEMDPAQKKISFDKGPGWRTLLLKAYGQWIEENCMQFPMTYQLLKQCKQVPTILFSILEPGAVIPPHNGQLKGILRYHLALKVPRSGDCFIKVGGEEYRWKEGEGFLFDDVFLHEVQNNTDACRIVLFMDVKRPLPKWLVYPDALFHWLAIISPKFKKAKRAGLIKVDL